MFPYLLFLLNSRKNNSDNIKPTNVEPKKIEPKKIKKTKSPCIKCNSQGWINVETGLPIAGELDAQFENMFEDEPKYIICPNCLGTGYFIHSDIQYCIKCNSSGWINVETGLPIARGLDAQLENMFEDEPKYIICPNCLGTGHPILKNK